MCFCGVNCANSAISSLIGIQGYPHCVATRSWMWFCGVKNQGHPPSASRHVFGSAHVLLWCGLHNARDILHDRSHKKTQLFRDSFLTLLLRNMQTQFRNFFDICGTDSFRNLRHRHLEDGVLHYAVGDGCPSPPRRFLPRSAALEVATLGFLSRSRYKQQRSHPVRWDRCLPRGILTIYSWIGNTGATCDSSTAGDCGLRRAISTALKANACLTQRRPSLA